MSDLTRVTVDDLRSMSKLPRLALETIIRNSSVFSFDELAGWAQGLLKLELTFETRLLHSFLLSTMAERYEQLGYELQEANERD